MKYTEEMILQSDSGYCMPFEEQQGKDVELSLGYGEQTDPVTGEKFFHTCPRNSLSKKSCRIRLTRKKHKELYRHRRNTNNRIWNFNRHLPFSIRECQVFFFFSRRNRFECI